MSSTTLIVGLWVLVIVQGFVLVVLVFQLAELRNIAIRGQSSILNRIPVGSAAPRIIAMGIDSKDRFDSQSLTGKRTVLLLMSRDCATCAEIAAGLDKLDVDDGVNLVVYFAEEKVHAPLLKRIKAAKHITVIRQRKMDVIAEFGVLGLPAAIVIDGEWRIVGYFYPSSAKDINHYTTEFGVSATHPQHFVTESVVGGP